MRAWLSNAYKAANEFSGTEEAERRLFKPLMLFEAFVRRETGSLSSENEQKIISEAFGEAAANYPSNVVAFLGVASRFYQPMKAGSTSAVLLEHLKRSGATIVEKSSVFVKTDDGRINLSNVDSKRSYDVCTQPRLAILLEKLRDEGVSGQPIYLDDVVITRGQVEPTMMREHPYIIVQIPRLNCEIALCEQVGEMTFVKRGTVGTEFWVNLSKDHLKEREDITPVMFRGVEEWWDGLIIALQEHSEPNKKVDVENWRNRKPNLDVELIKESLLAHRRATGGWLSAGKAGSSGKAGSFILKHGPYAGLLTCGNLGAQLRKGGRGLLGGSSIPILNEEVSYENGLDYKNRQKAEDFDINKIRQSLLAHRERTGKWLTSSKKGHDQKAGSYVLQHGPYAGEMTVKALDAALRTGSRGLPGGSSIAMLNQEVSDEHDLDYQNYLEKEDLDIKLIIESLLAHRLSTGEWLSNRKRSKDDKGSFILEYGPYAGEVTVSALDGALARGARGLPGGSSISVLNEEISREHGLDYQNHLKLKDINIELIKASILAHRLATGDWLSNGKKPKGETHGSYVLEFGPYAGQLTCSALETALLRGKRGLPDGLSIAKINQEVSEENGLDYQNRLEQEDYDLELIKQALLAHRSATGKWLSSWTRAKNGKPGSYVLEHGEYGGMLSVHTLDAALRVGSRGLPDGYSIAKLNQEISDEHGLDYKRGGNSGHKPSPSP